MDLQSEHQTSDYLSPSVSDIAKQRGGQENDPSKTGSAELRSDMTRSVAKQLLPACLAVPQFLWWILFYGRTQGWYDQQTSNILFLFSVTVVFGVIVLLNLRRLSRLDIERLETQEQLKRAKEAAEAANRFKSAFFANISHEIRTPLTAINGFAELMLNVQRTPEERMADAKVIRRNGEHLLALINDILDLSKIEAGKMSVERILCSPAQIVGEVGSMLRHRAAEKGLKLDLKFDGQIPKNISTDPTRLRQILINLVANAIKFTKTGGVSVEVSVQPSLRAVKPQLQVKITDTGIGMSSEQQTQLFQPFVQADTTITRQFGGSGLGLAISRHFSRALGGDITVTSQAGKGSTFIVTVETGALADADIEENPQQAMEIRDKSTGPNVRIKGAILVAEDGIDNQALIATRLRQTGLSVEIAPNGKIACDKALAALRKDQPFDLILMDVQMPVMDGYNATLNLRSKGYRGPIIALTANAMERDRNKCLQAGCNDFVTKPIQLDKLFKAIGRYLAVENVSSDGTAQPGRDMQINQFFAKLPNELAEINGAIEREDRQRLKEIVQLILGQTAALGLKDLAPEAARLLQLAQNESSWKTIEQAATDFTQSAQPASAIAA